MEYSIIVALVLGVAALLFLRVMLPRDSRIPPGSDGWPLIGETLSFANTDPLEFVSARIRKYGPIFRSHLVGVPSIVATTPKMARFIYSESSLFKTSYPSTISNLVGKKSLSNCDPKRHPFLKRTVSSALFPETLRREVSRLEGYVVDHLHSWDGRTVNTVADLKEFTLRVSVYFIFGVTDINGSEAQTLVQIYRALSKAFYVLPINLPGFAWHKAMQSKKEGCKYLATIIAKSRENSQAGKPCNSVLRALVDAKDEEGKHVDDDEIIDVLIGTLFGALDTTASALTWIIKFLSDNPDILKTVEVEQERISALKGRDEPLSWEDTRKMPYTRQVIQETLRNPTILQFTARASTQDVEYKGYLIPKGWRVFVMTTWIHLNPENHSDPTKFNPSRFKVPRKPGTYLPFAGGVHMCPGNELAKLVLLVFVHHLTTKFSEILRSSFLENVRWESAQPDQGTEFKPFAMPKGGFPIRVHRRVNPNSCL